MDQLRRFKIDPSCVFCESFGDLAYVRSRHTVVGNPTIVKSPWGPAMEFDGDNDYITLSPGVGESTRFSAGTQDFTILTMFRPDPNRLGGVIFSNEDGVDDGIRYWMSGGGTMNLYLDSIDTTCTVGAIQASKWQVMACTVDRDGVATMYLDGNPNTNVQPNISGEVMSTTITPSIGSRAYDNSLLWEGAIHSVLMFNRLVTRQELLNLSTTGAF